MIVKIEKLPKKEDQIEPECDPKKNIFGQKGEKLKVQKKVNDDTAILIDDEEENNEVECLTQDKEPGT